MPFKLRVTSTPKDCCHENVLDRNTVLRKNNAAFYPSEFTFEHRQAHHSDFWKKSRRA
jgi:hypothetical protein